MKTASFSSILLLGMIVSFVAGLCGSVDQILPFAAIVFITLTVFLSQNRSFKGAFAAIKQYTHKAE